MSKVLIYGNGESRKNWDITKTYKGFETWGCNAIYRDCTVDTLVGIDYGIQQEIYQSGYAFLKYILLHNVYYSYQQK